MTLPPTFDLDTANSLVMVLRWPEGVTCPKCEGKAVSYLSTRRVWKCKGCKKQFSVKVGTIFEDSPIGLDKWLCAVWMIANEEISSYQLSLVLGVTQKTALAMLRKICPERSPKNKRIGNPKIMAKNARRRAIQKNACPKWVDKKALEEIYQQAAIKTITTGMRYHVDHIIPLCNPHICGLHVPWNLQIITKEENQKKLNTFDLVLDFPNGEYHARQRT